MLFTVGVDVVVEYGSNVDLQCVIESILPSLDINWTSTTVSDESLQPIETANATATISIVTLRNVTFEDSGEYYCDAEDDEETYVTYFTVIVEGVSSY